MRKYDTIDFAMTAEPPPIRPEPTPKPGAEFILADGGRIECLNETEQRYKIVNADGSTRGYTVAERVTYEPTLARQYFAQRAHA